MAISEVSYSNLNVPCEAISLNYEEKSYTENI